MKNKKQFLTTLSLLLIFSMGLAIRLLFLPASTIDMKVFNLKWYDYIVNHGILNALGDEFSNYTPPYIYLLSLATLTKSFLPKLTAIKLIPITFDLINLILVYQIVKTNFGGIKPILAGMIFWILPTVVINGSFWGQVDGQYTCFLLLCLLLLLKDRWIAAVIAFSISFAIKAQALFLLPLLAILFFKKRIPWCAFLLTPLVYFIIMLPAILAGRSIASLASIYLEQAGTFNNAAKNVANFYFFLPPGSHQVAVIIGLPLAGLLLLTWALIYGFKHYQFSPAILTTTALISLALTPFLLPKMHDRYFYPADVFSLIVAFFVPELWFVPIAYQLISLLSYIPYLFGSEPQATLPMATLINAMIIFFLLWKQWNMTSNHLKREKAIIKKDNN
jgi:Gpi18-like mannosyltransferase